MRRLALALALAGCARLTPPTLPAERLETDRLSRARAAGEPLSLRDQRRLAVLIDRYDNAPDRADLIDGELDDMRARQARAWRGWARLVPGWATRLTDAIVADPGDPGAAALAGLLPETLDGGLRARLEAAEGLHPVARCLVEMRGGERACADEVEADVDAALETLAAIDARLDPEADRLLWTLATFGPVPRPTEAAAAAARWLRDWPRHADAWAMAGASAAADHRAAPAERLAWAGAAWHRAVGLHPGTVRARLALAGLESERGLPAAAEVHREAARLAIGAEVPLPEGWARSEGLPPWMVGDHRPFLVGPEAIEAAPTPPRPVDRHLERVVLVVGPPGVPVRVRQRFTRQPTPWRAGCGRRGVGLVEEICRDDAPLIDGAVWVPFPTDAAVARATVEVFAPATAGLTFESHGGAPGAEMVDVGPDSVHARFTLDGLDPVRDGARRPRVKVRVAAPIPGVVDPPEAGMVDRFEAMGEARPVPGDPLRTVARLRAAGIDAVSAWIAVDGRPQAVWARPEGEGWRWFDADAAPLTADGPIIAASRAEWIGRRPSAIARAAPSDLPSSDHPPIEDPPPRRP